MLTGRSLLSIEDLNKGDIELVLKNASSFMEVLDRKVKKVPALRGKTIATVFFEPSTRTKNSFEIAAKRLSADLITFTSSTSSLKKGESITDTINTITAMKVNLLIIRHAHSGVLNFLAQKTDIPIINAGDGKHQHPSQALLDLYTIYKHFDRYNGLKIAIVGDYLNSRVARSNVWLFKKMGMDVTIVAPSMFLPEDASITEAKLASTIDEVIEEADIVYMLRMQVERQGRKLYPSVNEYNRFLGLNLERLGRMKKESIVMHPGPVNRGTEISEEIMEKLTGSKGNSKIMIQQQVTCGVAVRMALLYLILS
ncbi:MAG: aspartate carbamoyltransferase catalytic subunit [Actinomycetota bacterium]|nr:aspartate carbamoyltransferase catalytic subunit [Actinomycetota bacterium]